MWYVIKTGTNHASSHVHLTVMQQEYINMWEGIHQTALKNL
jgi:hypothetical protein